MIDLLDSLLEKIGKPASNFRKSMIIRAPRSISYPWGAVHIAWVDLGGWVGGCDLPFCWISKKQYQNPSSTFLRIAISKFWRRKLGFPRTPWFPLPPVVNGYTWLHAHFYKLLYPPLYCPYLHTSGLLYTYVRKYFYINIIFLLTIFEEIRHNQQEPLQQDCQKESNRSQKGN